MKPADIYTNIELQLRTIAPEIGLTPSYVVGFLSRHEIALKTILLQNWPVWPIPRREDYLNCERCPGGLHRRGDPAPIPHVAIHNILCHNQHFKPLRPPGQSMADDMIWSRYEQQFTAQWGLCGVCSRIVRLYTIADRRGTLIQHRRPIDRRRDGRKRTEPDCDGARTVPVVMTRVGP